MTSETVEVDVIILLYAFRYALGRMTYSVGDVSRALIEHRDKIKPDWRRQIVQDIDNAVNNEGAGMACDIDKWREVQRVMSE